MRITKTETERSLFLCLLRVALGTSDDLTIIPTPKEWYELYREARKQTVQGLLYTVLERLSDSGKKPPTRLIFEWFSESEQIATRNRVVNKRCVEVSRLFEKARFKSCILKGQGNSILYSSPLSRMSGDIDIWIDGDKEKIVRFVKNKIPNVVESRLHIDFPIFDDVLVEVHFRPSILRSFIYNRRLQSFYDSLKEEQFQHHAYLYNEQDLVCIPTPEFNIVMQLSHIMGHFFEEGIGMRQIIDVFFLLKSYEFDDLQMKRLLRDLGMHRFAGALMWVLHEPLGMDFKHLIMPPDKKRGKLLLEEVLKDGNFGRYDQRNVRQVYKKSPLLYKIIRNLRFIRLFPMESFVSPLAGMIFRV